MVEESRKHSAEDQIRKDLVEARNMADQTSYQTEKTLKELGDKVSEDDRKAIESKVAELKQAMESDDPQRIRSLVEQVQQASMALGEAMYGDAEQGPAPEGPGPAPDGPPDDGPSDEDVVDGEFHSV
jgi:molecular chaperone DnaK